MVGLDGIISYGVEPQKEFHTSWNPKSKKASVDRSKLFAKKATLAWVVDCIDMYLRLINQAPLLICDEQLKNAIDSVENSRSVYKRIILVCNHYSIKSVDFALVDLLICWRNRLSHFQAENDISQSNRILLEGNTEKIKKDHCGLSIDQTLQSFYKSEFPTFKEITTFVRASVNLISQIDRCLLQNIDLVTYADRVVVKYLNEDKNRMNNLFSKDVQTRVKTIRQLLFQNGFILEEPNDVDEFCLKIANLSMQEARIKLTNRTII